MALPKDIRSRHGRSPIVRLLAACLLCIAVIWACMQADYTYGLAANILAGAVAGAAIGGLVIEVVRGLRASNPRYPAAARADSGWTGPTLTIVCAIVGAGVMGGIAWVSIGMDRNADRVEAYRAAKENRAPDR